MWENRSDPNGWTYGKALDTQDRVIRRKTKRIRKKFKDMTQGKIENRTDEAELSLHDANVLAALRLLGRADLEMLARVSLRDEDIKLEELASIFTSAGDLAFEMTKSGDRSRA